MQVEEEKKTEGRMNIEETWKMTCPGLKRLEGDKNCEETIEEIGIGKIEAEVDEDEMRMIPYSNTITKFNIREKLIIVTEPNKDCL